MSSVVSRMRAERAECPFCKIADSKEGIVRENRRVFAIEDANPKAETHLLVMPWQHVRSMLEATPDDILALTMFVQRLANERELEGYRMIVNVGEAGKQTVPHLHFHLLAGPEVVADGFSRSVG